MSIDSQQSKSGYSSSWELDTGQFTFSPISPSWLVHANAYDRDRLGGPKLLATSAAKQGGSLRIRYVHPESGQFIHCLTAAFENEDGLVPLALQNGKGWPRSLHPGCDPEGFIEGCEFEHMVRVWSSILDDDEIPQRWYDVIAGDDR